LNDERISNMAGSISSREQSSRKIMQFAMLWLYPRLREQPPEAWEPLISKARDTDFEIGEWIGIVGGMALVAWLLNTEMSSLSISSRFVAHLLQFLLALPLLVAVVGPIYLRRTRRGLDLELARRPRFIRTANTISEGKDS